MKPKKSTFEITAVLIALLALPLACGREAAAQPTIPTNVVRTIPHNSSQGAGLAFDTATETVWIASIQSQTIENRDPYTGAQIKTITAPNFLVRGLTHDGTDLWIAHRQMPPTPSLYRVSTQDGTVLQSMVSPFTGGASLGLGFDGTRLLVSEEGRDRFHRIDRGTGMIIATTPVPATPFNNPRDLAWDTRTSTVWSANQSNLVRQHDPLTGALKAEFTSPTTLSGGTQGIGWDGHFLWIVGDYNPGRVFQVDVTPPFLNLVGALSPGQMIQFRMTQATGRGERFFVVAWSGSGTNGFQVGNVTIPLTFDTFTNAGLALIPFFSAPLDAGGNGTTPAFRWPAVPVGVPFHVCGVTLDNQGVARVTEPFKYVARP